MRGTASRGFDRSHGGKARPSGKVGGVIAGLANSPADGTTADALFARVDRRLSATKRHDPATVPSVGAPLNRRPPNAVAVDAPVAVEAFD